MKAYWITTEDDAPTWLEKVSRPEKRQLREGVFLLFTRSPEIVLHGYAGQLDQLTGILLVPGGPGEIQPRGATLFEADAAPDLTPQTAQGLTALLQGWKGEKRRSQALAQDNRELETQLRRLNEFYQLTQQKLQEDLLQENRWLTNALTRLIHFSTRELQTARLEEIPLQLSTFLLQEIPHLSGITLFEHHPGEEWIVQHHTGTAEIPPPPQPFLEGPFPGADPGRESPCTPFPHPRAHPPPRLPDKKGSSFSPPQKAFLEMSLSLASSITEARMAEKQLISASASAEQANQAKSYFLANMSHEIRTPLNGILGMLQILQLEQLTPEQQEYVRMASLSGKNLLELVNDILDFSKIEADQMEVRNSPFSLETFNQEIRDSFLNPAREKSLGFSFTTENPRGIQPRSDSTRIRQILTNLISNAVKFTDRGEVAVTSRLLPPQTRTGSSELIYTVRDTGPGISPEYQKKIFDPFTQEDPTAQRQHQGTGLGLAIVKRLVNLLQGRIRLESRPGGGTVFTVTLPVTQAVPSSPETGEPEKKDPAPGPGKTALLVAEDNPVNRLLLQDLLEADGYTVEAVRNGHQLLEALEKNLSRHPQDSPLRFRAVLTDIQMPGISGTEAAIRIRRGDLGPQARKLPLIAVTAYAMAGDREHFLNQGFDGYLAKPLEIEKIRKALFRYL